MHCFHKLKETTRPSWKNKNKQVSSQPSPRRSGFWIAKNSSFTLQPASLGYLRLSINPSSQLFFSACQENSLLPKKKKKLKKWRETCESPSKTTPSLTSLPRPPPPAPPIHTPPTLSFSRRGKWRAHPKNQQLAKLGALGNVSPTPSLP